MCRRLPKPLFLCCDMGHPLTSRKHPSLVPPDGAVRLSSVSLPYLLSFPPQEGTPLFNWLLQISSLFPLIDMGREQVKLHSDLALD